MTRLRSVRLRGFKTFAKPTELVFEPGVTVIIGPNGSGKSNIADAVLWVLGEQSPGNLRGRTMQDVLHSGPSGRKSSAVAEVSLIFDGEGDRLPLDGRELEVTRRLVRDNGSEYLVNGVECRLIDVQDVVAGLGIGREMHSVISQGKVEALLASTPEVRRATVEEAAGLGRFKKRRERAQAKLERTRQNLLRVSDIEREVKAALRPLRQQVAAAERFAEATEDWALARAKSILLELMEVQAAGGEKDKELAGLEGRRGEIEAALNELRKQRVMDEARFSDGLREREDANAGYHRARVAAERVEARAIALRQRLARMEGEQDRARRRLELALSEVATLSSRLREITSRTADETRLQTVTAGAEAIRTRLEEALPAYRAAVAEEDDLKDSIFELETARTRALQDRDFLRRELEEKKRVGSELTTLAKAASTRVDQLRGEAAEFQRGRAAGERAALESAKALEMAASEREEARSRVDESSRGEASVTEQSAGLESRRAVLQDVLARREGIPAGTRQLMEVAGECRLLAEVVKVEPGYERAFAAALGSLVQALVFAGSPDVARALGGEGPLEAIWESDAPRVVASGAPPAGTRDLWDLVTGPERVLATLRTLVPPTAVVRDDARFEEVAPKQRRSTWRVVSRSGELAEAGLHVARRRELSGEALLKATNELESVEREQAALLARRDEARRKSAEAVAAMEEAEARFRKGEEALLEAERRMAAQKNESELLARRIEESETQCAELLARNERETALAGQMGEELRSAEQKMILRDAELEAARLSLRTVQASLETMRKTVALLEEKKGRAALLEVKLRERCRARAGELERIRGQREAAVTETARCERRAESLGRYVPALTLLLSVVGQLAERSRGAVAVLAHRVEEARARSEGAARVVRDWGGAETELQAEYDRITDGLPQTRVDRARLEDRRSLIEAELAELRRRHISPRTLEVADVVGEEAEALAASVQRAERRRERIGPVNPLAERECVELEERNRFLAEQRSDLESSIEQLQEVIAGLDQHIERVFGEIFEATRHHFSAVIATVFPGARGALRLTEPMAASQGDENGEGASLDELDGEGKAGEGSRGIELEVRLPNKAPRSLSLLSGGEKAMAAISFLFSLFLARPCPFYILDEVEASLDDINIRRFLALVREYRNRTQFIVITHQRQTMEVADTLYGVALEDDGTSRVLSRRLGKKEDPAEAVSTPHLQAEVTVGGA